MTRSALEHVLRAAGTLLPREWRSRAIEIRSDDTEGVTGICPDPADLAVSKLAAWREKDRDFVRSLLRHGLATTQEIDLAR